jgi:hypothetical protein
MHHSARQHLPYSRGDTKCHGNVWPIKPVRKRIALQQIAATDDRPCVLPNLNSKLNQLYISIHSQFALLFFTLFYCVSLRFFFNCFFFMVCLFLSLSFTPLFRPNISFISFLLSSFFSSFLSSCFSLGYFLSFLSLPAFLCLSFSIS